MLEEIYTNARLLEGQTYWLTFKDGSRIIVETTMGKYGDIDARNDSVGFFMWMGNESGCANREEIAKIERVIPEIQSCPFTHAHTREWCGRSTCRDS